MNSGISPEVLGLGVVFLLDFCTSVFNKILMFSPHERKIHLHYISGWPVSVWQLPGSSGGFFSAFNLSLLQFHSPVSRLILCMCCALNRHCVSFTTVIFFVSEPSCVLNSASESGFPLDYLKLHRQVATFVCGGERSWSVL